MTQEIPRFAELSRFVRNWLEAVEMNVPQAALFLFPIPQGRIYDIVEGRRAFDGWEVSLFHKRTGLLIPHKYLRGADRFERPVKTRPINQKMFDLLLKEAEVSK